MLAKSLDRINQQAEISLNLWRWMPESQVRVTEVLRPHKEDAIRDKIKSSLRRLFPIPTRHTPVMTSDLQCHCYCALPRWGALFSPAMQSTENTKEAPIFKVKTQLVLHLEASLLANPSRLEQCLLNITRNTRTWKDTYSAMCHQQKRTDRGSLRRLPCSVQSPWTSFVSFTRRKSNSTLCFRRTHFKVFQDK